MTASLELELIAEGGVALPVATTWIHDVRDPIAVGVEFALPNGTGALGLRARAAQ
ncbi:hypothetical protein [Kitasatospora sp. GP30]|uniref:hypothetical protein n=1 Tax=Kitasatospora sp. GP30 TaxID=3035084 RepID=UPI002475682C|nr:hypothetical protein [Kitasatospora sp. GP30]